MANDIEKKTLQSIIENCERTRADMSSDDSRTIESLRTLLTNDTKTLSADSVFALLSQHQWNKGKKTAVDICVARILAKIFDANFDITQDFPKKLMLYLKSMAHYGFLNDLEMAQANFNKITQNVKYVTCIVDALAILHQAGLLSEEHARANFNAITQGTGQYARYIARILSILQSAGLLSGEHAQRNRDAITQRVSQYAEDITTAVYILDSKGLLSGEHAQANFNAITQGTGQYAKPIARALSILNSAGLLSGEHAQRNRDAITQGTGQYAEYIAHILSILQSAGLLRGDHAQANFNAINIKKFDSYYAEYITRILSILNSAGLLSDEHAQANFNTITKAIFQEDAYLTYVGLNNLQSAGLLSGQHAQANFNTIIKATFGEYAYWTDLGFNTLQSAGLLSGQHAQANFNAITHDLGESTMNITQALLSLQSEGLLRGENAQKNVDLLFRYVRLSENNYGIKFALKCMRKLLTQEKFSLLMLDESVSLGKKQLAFFSEIFSFDLPVEEDINDKKFDYWALVKPMMCLHEYIHTYFPDEEKSEVLNYFKDMLESNTSVIDCSTKLFAYLCQNFCHRGNHSSILSDENNPIKQMMLAILEMLAKSRNPDASFSTDIFEMIDIELHPYKTLSATDIGSPSVQETKTEESEHQMTDPVNERIVTLLYFSFCQSPETFRTACAILQNFSVPRQLTRFSAAFNNASLFQESKKPVSDPLLNGVALTI